MSSFPTGSSSVTNCPGAKLNQLLLDVRNEKVNTSSVFRHDIDQLKHLKFRLPRVTLVQV